ncbi:MAG: M48 family metalloprotease [Planctomycetota bacterium]
MFGKVRLLILGVVLCLSAGCETNPITGRQELMFIPQDQDLELGRKYAPEIEKEMGGRIEDDSLQSYIDSVGQKIARISHRSDWEYHFAALKDDSVNAFALPGGYIFVTKGMLEHLETEAQLAAVLAHEMVHVVARDTSNAMSNQIGMGLLLSAVTSEETSQGVLTAANLTSKIIGLRYSRKDEREADLGGLSYMVAAGYNPNGMVETMQMLEEQQKSKTIEFLSSHPSPENRVGYLTQEVQMNYFNSTHLRVGKEDYHKAVRGRLKD